MSKNQNFKLETSPGVLKSGRKQNEQRSPYDGIFNLQVRKLQYKNQYDFHDEFAAASRAAMKESIQRQMNDRNMLLL